MLLTVDTSRQSNTAAMMTTTTKMTRIGRQRSSGIIGSTFLLLLLICSRSDALKIPSASSSKISTSSTAPSKTLINQQKRRNRQHSATTNEESLTAVPDETVNNNHNQDVIVSSRGGGGVSGDDKVVQPEKPPSIYWAVLHNWMYFLSLGFNLINVPFMIRQIVDGTDATSQVGYKPSSQAISLSGKVESVDKFLTFLGVGFLSALSDKYGRKPLMAWSALGFMLTNIIQAQTRKSVALLYLADFVDGCSSCMLPLCQTFVTDCSTPADRAANLGIFQGLSGTYIC